MIKFFILFFPTLLLIAMAQAEVASPSQCVPLSKVGIGVVLSKGTSGEVFVDEVLPGKPAHKYGMSAKDQILGVTSIPGSSFVPAESSTLEELVDLIRGEEGTVVILDVLRGEAPLQFQIIREKFSINC